MDILRRYKFIFDPLSTFAKVILVYLVFSSPQPQFQDEYKRKNLDQNLIQNYKQNNDYKKRNGLEKKLLLDLSKNQVSNLVDADLPITVSIDAEGKIIGYRPFISKIPSYWNSEITKRFLIKNNFFSLSYKKDQVISFQLSSF